MQFKSNIKASLDSVRKEVNEKENNQISYHAKKVLLFITYINNKIENLLKKEVCKNADIIKEYYLLNKFPMDEVNNIKKIDISDWKSLFVYDINVYELAFKEKLADEILDSSDSFKWLGVKINMILNGMCSKDHYQNTDIKNAFKELEKINKKISTYYKVHGYLKDMRLEQQNTVLYNIKPVKTLFQ